MGLVENDNAIFAELTRHTLGNLRVEKIVVRVDDDVAEGKHSSDREVRTRSGLLAVVKQRLERINATGNQVVLVVVVQFLVERA